MAYLSGGKPSKRLAANTKAAKKVKAAYGARAGMNKPKGDGNTPVQRTLSRKLRNASKSSSQGTNRGIGKPLNRPGGANAYQ